MKKKIALVTGGYSSEHQISLNSSREIARAIDPARYEVYPIHITRDSWVYKPAAGDPSPVDRNDFSIRIGKEKVLFDAAFVVIHGSPGEDSQLEGYFDMLNIPYTCSGVLASALTFDKIACKQYLAPFGVKYAPTVVLRKGEKLDSGQIINELGLPLFVKPNEGGSSFGITKVKEANELDTAVRKAFEEDSTVL